MNEHLNINPSGEIAYYLSDFTDEIIPCETTLEGWAAWLSKPDAEWDRDEAAKDGDIFEASALRFDDDIVATRRAGNEWTFSHEIPEDAALLAVRFGFGMGWWPDNIITPDFDLPSGASEYTWQSMREALIAFLNDPNNEADDEEYIAVAYEEPKLMLIYRVNPPRLEPTPPAPHGTRIAG